MEILFFTLVCGGGYSGMHGLEFFSSVGRDGKAFLR
jgi:hypothetical protein